MSVTEATYSDDAVQEGLVAIVACGGNCADAHRKLKETAAEDSVESVPSARTLRDWKSDMHAERYRRLQQTYDGELEEALVAKARANATAAAEVTALAIEEARAQLASGKAKDAGQMALNLAKVTGQSVQEVLRLTGRPTDGAGGSSDMLKSIELLVQLGVLKRPDTIESTATEIEPGEPPCP